MGTHTASLGWRRVGWVAVGSVLLMGSASWGAYIKSYNADVLPTAPDPTTADGGSWTAGGTSPTTVARTPGAEDGHNYWEVNDNNTNSTTGTATNNSVIYLVQNTTDANLTTAMTSPDGWDLTVRLKVISSANPTLTPPSYNVPTFIDIRNGRRIYDLAFVNDGTNNGVYHPAGGTTFTADSSSLVAAVDLSVYHTFDMVMVPNAADHTLDVVNIYVDGGTTPVATFNDSNSTASTVTRVQFGSGLAAATQDVRWEQVTFQTPVPVPEPGVVGVVGVISLGLVGRRRR